MFHKSTQNVDSEMLTKAKEATVEINNEIFVTDSAQPVPHFSCLLNRGLEYLCS